MDNMDIPNFYGKKKPWHLRSCNPWPKAQRAETFCRAADQLVPDAAVTAARPVGTLRGFEWELLKWDILIVHAYNDSTVYYM